VVNGNFKEQQQLQLKVGSVDARKVFTGNLFSQFFGYVFYFLEKGRFQHMSFIRIQICSRSLRYEYAGDGANQAVIVVNTSAFQEHNTNKHAISKAARYTSMRFFTLFSDA